MYNCERVIHHINYNKNHSILASFYLQRFSSSVNAARSIPLNPRHSVYRQEQRTLRIGREE